jgi:hypothetical protein
MSACSVLLGCLASFSRVAAAEPTRDSAPKAKPQPAAAIESREGKRACELTLVVDGARASKVKLTLDGRPFVPGQVGAAQPVKLGRHVVTAVSGLKKIEVSADLVDGEKRTLRVSFPEEKRTTIEMSVPAMDPRAETSGPYRFDGWQRPVGLVVGGAGVLSLGVAGAFVLDALSRKTDPPKNCAGACKPQDRPDDGARATGNLAVLAAVTGFSLAGAGAVLYLTAPAPPLVKDLRFSPTFAQSGGGISAKASF